MNHYIALRQRANATYRATCARARKEYLRTIKRIDDLQKTLGKPGKRPAYHPRSIFNVLADLIPRDRVFSVSDMFKLIGQVESDRPVSPATIKTYMSVFEKEGRIKRVRRERRSVIYADKRLKVQEAPYVLLTQWEVAQDLIQKHGPLRTEEIVVKMHDAGFKTEYSAPRLKRSLRTNMATNARFAQDEQKRWVVL